MSHSIHPNLTADQRAERRARRQPRPMVRRSGTRSAVVAAELAEITDLLHTNMWDAR
jgi:hypothetical protein